MVLVMGLFPYVSGIASDCERSCDFCLASAKSYFNMHVQILENLSMRILPVVVFSLGALGLTGSSMAFAAGTATLVPHRAIYDLKLDSAQDSSGITGLTGRMVYEFNGSDCEGYTTNFRFVTRVDMEEQPQRVTDQQTTTFESGNGDKFRFVNKTFVDQSLTKEVRGDAALLKDKTEISLTKPEASK